MKKGLMSFVLSGVVASTLFASAAFAQAENIPGHPRVNEVDQRLENQQNRINENVENGTITGKQAVRDEKRDERIQEQVTRDEAKHNGHLTKREQRRINHELNKNSHIIKRQHIQGKKKLEGK